MSAKNIASVIFSNSSSAFIIKVIGTGIAFIVQIILARVLGADQYGAYIYILAWINVVALIAKLGFDTLLVRMVSAYKIKEKWSHLKGIIVRSTQISLAFSIFLSLVVYVLFSEFTDLIEPEHKLPFLIGLCLVPILTLTGLRQGTLQALKEIPKSQIPEAIIRPFFLLLFFSSIYLLIDNGISATEALLANIAAASVAFAIGTYWLIGSIPQETKHVKPAFETNEWLKISIPLLVISGLHMILGQTDILMLGALLNTEATGVYGAASRVAGLVSFGLVAVNSIVAPLISEYYAQKSMADMQRMITISANGIFAFAAVASAVLIVAGPTLLSIFGEEFVVGYNPLIILLIGQIVSSLAGSVGFLMVMTGNQKKASAIIFYGAIANIILNYILIPIYGVVGAAIATSVSTVFWNLLMLCQVVKTLRINPTILSNFKYLVKYNS
ncbi:MAG: flippase [Candidatus Thiodiazotropha sp.]